MLDGGGRQVLQLLPRDGREEVEVVRAVEAALEVFSDPAEVVVGGQAEVDGRNVRHRIPVGVEQDVEGHAEVSKFLDREQRRQDGLADLKKTEVIGLNQTRGETSLGSGSKARA